MGEALWTQFRFDKGSARQQGELDLTEKIAIKETNFQIVFLVAALLLSIGCNRAASQSQPAGNKSKDCGAAKTRATAKDFGDYEYVGERTNEKYNFSFQVTALNNENWKGFDVSVRKMPTKRCLLYKTAYFDEGLADKAVDIFSPDKEFLALPCGDDTSGYCIYKMAKIAEYFNDAGNFSQGKGGGNYCSDGSDTFKNLIEKSDSIEIVDAEGNETYAHKFIGWKTNAIVAFQIRAEDSDDWHEFSYDVKEKKIYGAPEKFGAAKNERGTIKNSR